LKYKKNQKITSKKRNNFQRRNGRKNKIGTQEDKKMSEEDMRLIKEFMKDI